MKYHQAVPWLWLLAAGAAGTTAVKLFTSTDPLIHAAPTVELSGTDERVVILWLGDVISLADNGSQEQNLAEQINRLRVRSGADVVVANAEASTDLSAFWDPITTGTLVLSLANTTLLDGQVPAVSSALSQARSAGVLTFGAGTNFIEAGPSTFVPPKPDCRREATCWQPEYPLIVRTPYGSIGVVALAEDYGLKSRLPQDTAGFVLLQLSVKRGIHMARRAGADWVVAYVHWGQDYKSLTERQRSWARAFAAAGYDLMIGHHPRAVQPIEVVDGMPAIYSLGQDLMLSTEIPASGRRRLRLHCITSDEEIASDELSMCQGAGSNSLRLLHPGLEIEGRSGVLPWLARQPNGTNP